MFQGLQAIIQTLFDVVHYCAQEANMFGPSFPERRTQGNICRSVAVRSGQEAWQQASKAGAEIELVLDGTGVPGALHTPQTPVLFRNVSMKNHKLMITN